MIPLSDAYAADTVGGKAAALGSLLRADCRIPDGFVVAAREPALESLEPAILDAFDKLGARRVAIRSSATGEDSRKAAWAGQLDTFLNVSRDTLLEHIVRCVASADSARAQAYAAQKNLAAGKVAVIVQTMIDSDVSGVCFSVHPVARDDNQVVIEAAYGLGEAVVSGEITPDSYVVSRQPRSIISCTVAHQAKSLRFSESSHKTTWQVTVEPSAQKLSDPQILELADTAVGLEAHFGYPVDVEWAFYNGKLYILQSRPITTLQ